MRVVVITQVPPAAHGLTALHKLKTDRADLSVLVLTGFDDEVRGTQAVAAGAQDYLVKGQIDGQGLARAVRYAVAGPLRDVVVCHCSRCLRTHGHAAAYTACARSDLALVDAIATVWGSERQAASTAAFRGSAFRASTPSRCSVVCSTMPGAAISPSRQMR